ncbi:hypothetical protein D3C71_1368080 [compost metagenome]
MSVERLGITRLAQDRDVTVRAQEADLAAIMPLRAIGGSQPGAHAAHVSRRSLGLQGAARVPHYAALPGPRLLVHPGGLFCTQQRQQMDVLGRFGHDRPQQVEIA